MIKLKMIGLGAVFALLAAECALIPGQASAATPACQAVAGGVCGSWDTPVAGGVDLDVYQQRAASDTQVIVWRQSSTDPAEDFELLTVPAPLTSTYPALHDAETLANAVNIEYAPDGIPSGFCVSVITSTARARAALRPCDMVSLSNQTFNPYQTFNRVAASDADGSFTVYQNVLSGLVLNDARSGGAGSPVISYPLGSTGSTPNQLWEANG
jgi:hypothetical protein